ncbi:MAG: hypothetical protein ACT4N2_03855 [Hyphomicrobium sp.]
MRLSEYVRRVLGLAVVVSRWSEPLVALDAARRERLAIYAERVADTLARAADGLVRLETDPTNRGLAHATTREFGRIRGYVETIVHASRPHLDGRKLAGVKRRLKQLEAVGPDGRSAARGLTLQIERLLAAEGYFRALADALRT